MATNVAIPRRTIAVGQTTFGPLSIQKNYTQATISIDRTVTGGLNDLTGATQLDVLVQTSADGVNWSDEAEALFGGGPDIDSSTGLPFTTSSIQVTGINPGELVRVVATVTGPSSVVVQGSLSAQ